MIKIKNYVLCATIFMVWTLLMIYGTYYNTVEHARLVGADAPYQLVFDNTGEVYNYE